ncbi:MULTISPECIES: AraC family transcriptional regulator [Paenibacillus]|uniref:AraC family transcriptional regulator n=1 Tax=Paenibacillus violae TaxID=3077234 RepID=A0ABU3RQ17_9BACL|nr:MULTISPECIES: AraC family transcriptional regulator [Paenibacillus]MDU0206253.1 AraC family transcriptional regulator [Paenibacillus sp. PFR10]MEC0271367.1 AraC family transcriptional regulator [Paenibacillus anseongense]
MAASFFDQNVKVAQGIVFEEKLAVYTEHEFHMHTALEVSIALDSTMKYPIGDEWYYADPGDILLLRPFEPHWNLTREEGKPSRWIMLLFSPDYVAFIPDGYSLLVPFYTMNTSQVIPAASPYAQSIMRLALEALEEQKQDQPGWELQQMTLFIQILVQIQRYYHSLEQSFAAPSLSGVIAAIEHLITHWSEEVDVDLLIQRSDLKKTWFYTKFRELTGSSPNEFIIRLRLQYAAHMLMHTHETITDIALACGFSTPSYFNKVFKEHRGMTPSVYRRQAATSNSITAKGD